MNSKPKSEKLRIVQIAVSPAVLVFISATARQESRTISQMGRLLLEESPRVKAATKNGKRGKAKK